MAKIDIALQMLREQFTEALREAFAARFGMEIETSWNIFAMTYVTTPPEGQRLKSGHKTFIAGFEAAWLKASSIVAEER